MMKRQIDYRLLATLALGLAVAIGLAFLVHAVQMRRHARTLMAQAQQAESEGRFDQAMRAWQRYLVFFGKYLNNPPQTEPKDVLDGLSKDLP